ncbi:serine/threonine kinase PKN8 [Plesiocystis pacifica SIR-1]|uniref:Serine/threonine kinase PKN8 n=1 Tax=Plesiocystis pacifica SIR-1 TaxID=391625 RepID=A6GIT7_9BACT|nr:serine/threonine-protein kinase [Plesiocystis pacifica]EDM74232.1 serine/threonine kinase PKN8 [Plesiocystis pacifica SIR-1]
MSKLDESTIAAYLDGALEPDERAAVEAALDRDPEWLAVVAVIARRRQTEAEGVGPAPTPTAGGEPCSPSKRAGISPGTRVGRFEVLRRIATGGMGVVHEAWDATLERPVALKIALSPPRDDRARERQLREARTLAQLSAPNVVSVFDAGEHAGRIYVAMEKLSGPSLRAHLAAAQQDGGLGVEAIVRLFIEAARGLVAAHEKGIVHRDFKPDNVIVEADRVVVVDFGLALRAELGGEGSGAVELSQTDQPGGTPAYMAPEQRRGEAVTARSDQYSLCVALDEALAATKASIAPRLRAAIARGRAEDPKARHEDLAALIAALEAALAPPRWRSRALLGVLALGVLAGGASMMIPQADGGVAATLPPQLCAAANEDLDSMWSEAAKARLAAGLRSHDKDYLDAMVEPLAAAVDVHVEALEDGRVQACFARELGLDAAPLAAKRSACLDRRRASLENFLAFDWAAAEEAEAARSFAALGSLGPAQSCEDPERLRLAPPQPADPDTRAAVAELRRGLDEVELLHAARRLDSARERGEALVQQAEALGYAPVLAELRSELGWIATTADDHERANRELDAALLLAEANDYDLLVAQLWIRKLWAVGYIQADLEAGREAGEHAEAWLRRLGSPQSLRFDYYNHRAWFEEGAGETAASIADFEASLEFAEDDHTRAMAHSGLGAALLQAGELEQSAAHMREASEAFAGLLGPRHPDTAKARNGLAALVRALGKAEEARELFELNRAVFVEAYGEDHELVAKTDFNLAVLAGDLGDHQVSFERARSAADKLTASLGETHPVVLQARGLEASALALTGEGEAAIHLMRDVLESQRRALGPDNPGLAATHHNLGVALANEGLHAEALVEYERAVELLESGKDEDHYELGTVLVNYGLAHEELGREGEAERAYRRALEVSEGTMGEPEARSRLGRVLIARGRGDAGIQELERALELHREQDPGGVFVAQTAYNLGKALWSERSAQRPRAVALVEEAVELYDDFGDEVSAKDARAWLAERGLR